jgi:hypothetical protein
MLLTCILTACDTPSANVTLLGGFERVGSTSILTLKPLLLADRFSAISAGFATLPSFSITVFGGIITLAIGMYKCVRISCIMIVFEYAICK